MELDGNKRVFNRLGGGGASAAPDPMKQQKVCYHWRAGRCTRHNCPFLHHELPGTQPLNGSSTALKRFADDTQQFQRRAPPKFSGGSNTWGRVQGGNPMIKKAEKVCNFWMQGHCNYGDKCRFLHSWSIGGCFSMLTALEGHQKAVTGIAFPAGSSRLYSGSKDETVRIWDCQSGQCINAIGVGGDIGCMLSEGSWVFVGLTNLIKAWNIANSNELSLTGPVGQVYAMAVGGNGLLFAGIQDGSILAWKFNQATHGFEPAASLPGHTFPVVSLIVGANRLYSGSMDNTIRVWNLESLQCMQILTDHTSVVMSVLCWDQFLLSCSLDKTIKVWVANDSGNLEVTYTHSEEHGLLCLRGMLDPEGKPVLLCSCNDNCLRVYDLPSFAERDKIFSKQEIRAIEMGPAGMVFTGDGTGQVKVWKWLDSPVPQQ
ncbi:hypothetical protein MLD38_002862 [Melastoma candidum]|uniref:Uncharacterized protein n=1 Tax=Melastoma candidum TaxID=119954 RepID=A0ACB9S226_9MYRT|nr:hypothetical protein MLD38_002862 [Melastoma candidum]